MIRLSTKLLAICIIAGCQQHNPTGDPQLGQVLFLDRNKGHCLLCHQLQTLDAPSQGNLGPDLTNVGDRLNLDQLIERIADSRTVNPQTIMPAYHSTNNLNQVATQFRDQPVLSATEVVHVATFLSLQTQALQ